MFPIPLMIAGLAKQKRLLEEMLKQLEAKSGLNAEDCVFYDWQARRVAANLHKLRSIKQNYCRHLHASDCSRN